MKKQVLKERRKTFLLKFPFQSKCPKKSLNSIGVYSTSALIFSILFWMISLYQLSNTNICLSKLISILLSIHCSSRKQAPSYSPPKFSKLIPSGKKKKKNHEAPSLHTSVHQNFKQWEETGWENDMAITVDFFADILIFQVVRCLHDKGWFPLALSVSHWILQSIGLMMPKLCIFSR